MPGPRRSLLLAVSATATSLLVGAGVALAADSAPITRAESRVATPAAPADVRDLLPVVDGPEPARVPLRVSVDLTAADPLPEGTRTFDSQAVGSPLRVAGGYLAHGRADSAGALSFAEVGLPGEVSEIGARIRFAPQDSGSVAIVAWEHSFVEAAASGAATPRTGLRLVVSRGSWELSVVPDDVTVLASGTFPDREEVAVRLLRRGQQASVVAPDGRVTRVAHPAVARLAGRWASWGLTETGPEQNPAALAALWAG